jgi:ribose transport system substrate-binding protein
MAFARSVVLALALALIASSAVAQQRVALLTPYLASATTKIMVDAFGDAARDLGYVVTVIDTAGDLGALDSRLLDVVTQRVAAIVLSVNPELVPAGLEAAAAAGIPVFGLDAGSTFGLVQDVTSNAYAMAAQTATYLVDRLGGVGNVIMLTHAPYAPVQKRGAIARAIFDNTPDIRVLDDVFVAVPGPLENARNAVEAILTANPRPGSIAGIWAAWDEPALGALQAIEALGRGGEGIVIVGLDAIDPAREAIAAGSSFEATVAQDFVGIATTLAASIDTFLRVGSLAQKSVYVPSTLLTIDDLR